MTSNLMASDLLDIDWGERARNILANAGQSGTRPERVPEIRVPVRAEPVEVRERNVVTDPGSWLNRGLGNLLSSAADVVLGNESGNAVVDLGAANVPGIGPAAILAAGGMPGIIDVAGLGEVKGAIRGVKSILKNPIAKRFAERYEPEAVDALNKLVTKHPSLANMNTAEVYDVMQSGRLGNEYFIDLGKGYPEAFASVINPDNKSVSTHGIPITYDELLEENKDKLPPVLYDEFKKALADYRRLYDMGDMYGAFQKAVTTDNLFEAVTALDQGYTFTPERLQYAIENLRHNVNNGPRFSDATKEAIRETRGDPLSRAAAERLSEYVHLQKDPVSDWGRIIDMDDAAAELNASRKAEQEAAKAAAMERKAASEANRQAKAYEDRLKLYRKNPKKAMKDANSAAPKMVRDKGQEAVREWYFGMDPMKEAPVAPKEKPAVAPKPKPAAVKEEPAVAVETPSAVIEVPVEKPVGGPNRWRENGWKSDEHPLSNGLKYENILGRNATEEDRRAAFVVDSLMNEAVNDLARNKAMWWMKTNGEIGFSKKGNHQLKPGEVALDYGADWNDFRHNAYNYDEQRLRLSRDLNANLASGNMPKSSKVVLMPAVNKNTGNRIPGASVAKILDIDTYEDMFRPRVTRKIRETTPDYMR